MSDFVSYYRRFNGINGIVILGLMLGVFIDGIIQESNHSLFSTLQSMFWRATTQGTLANNIFMIIILHIKISYGVKFPVPEKRKKRFILNILDYMCSSKLHLLGLGCYKSSTI